MKEHIILMCFIIIQSCTNSHNKSSLENNFDIETVLILKQNIMNVPSDNSCQITLRYDTLMGFQKTNGDENICKINDSVYYITQNDTNFKLILKTIKNVKNQIQVKNAFILNDSMFTKIQIDYNNLYIYNLEYDEALMSYKKLQMKKDTLFMNSTQEISAYYQQFQNSNYNYAHLPNSPIPHYHTIKPSWIFTNE